MQSLPCLLPARGTAPLRCAGLIGGHGAVLAGVRLLTQLPSPPPFLRAQAFKAITGLAWDRKSIEWEWTDCNQEAAEKKRKEEERRAAEKKAAEQKRKEAERKKRQEAERKRDEEEKARTEAERAAADAEAAQQAQQEVQGQLAGPNTSNQTVPGGSPAAAAANATASTGNAIAPVTTQQERPVSHWVVPCAKGRQRCPNLSLAARGYQCTTKDGSACCLMPNGKLCKVLANYEEDTAAPAFWRGRDLTSQTAGDEQNEEASKLTETGGSGGAAPAAADEVAATAPSPETAPSPAAAEPPTEEEAGAEGSEEGDTQTEEPAPSPAAALAGRRMLKH